MKENQLRNFVWLNRGKIVWFYLFASTHLMRFRSRSLGPVKIKNIILKISALSYSYFFNMNRNDWLRYTSMLRFQSWIPSLSSFKYAWFNWCFVGLVRNPMSWNESDFKSGMPLLLLSNESGKLPSCCTLSQFLQLRSET